MGESRAGPLGETRAAPVASLEQGRAAYGRRAWEEARAALIRADDASPLGADDLELLAISAFMVGRVDDFLSALERAHHAHIDDEKPLRAVRCAFYVGVNLALRGDMGHAAGWFGRAQRLVDREEQDCVESGYLLMPVAMQLPASAEMRHALQSTSPVSARRPVEEWLGILAG